ncbi:MAG: SPOR domain-containing protein [Vicingaceae bacterium]
MTSGSDKEKKLKEIQERLAEIQGKTSNTVSAKTKTEATVQVPGETPKKESAVTKVKEPDKFNQASAQKKQAHVSPDLVKKKSVKTTAVPLIQSESKPAKGWTENKVIQDEELTKKNKKETGQPASNKSKKILSVVSLLITLFISSYIIYTFFLKNDGRPPAIVEANLPVMPNDKVAEEAPLQKELSDPTESSPAGNSNAPSTETPDLSERVNEARKERSEKIKSESSMIETSAIQSNKSAVPRGMIISYVSNSDENQAKKNVEYLKSKGFKAQYYYMPDKDAAAPAYFKVFIGPYKNESEALIVFKKVVAFNDKAYILKMDQ